MNRIEDDGEKTTERLPNWKRKERLLFSKLEKTWAGIFVIFGSK